MPAICELESIARAICQSDGYSFGYFIDSGEFKETFYIESPNGIYALKVFKANNANERTDREIDSMKRAYCSNVAQLFNVGCFSSSERMYLYTIEEYLDGGSLGSRLTQRLLTRTEILTLADDLLKALNSMYKERIVHRDIKPDNIMFRKNTSEAVLVDFGLVRDLDASSLTQTFLQRGPGTPFFSAPEQLNNMRHLIDWRTDQFALGITLCISVLGCHPFEAESVTESIENVASYQKCNAAIAKELKELKLDPILRMVEPYPIMRYRVPDQLINSWSDLERG